MSTRANSRSQPNPHALVTQPQHRHYYYYAAPPSSRSSSFSASATFKGCCCCLFLLLSFLALITLASLLVILFTFKPKKPQLELQQVTVQYITITPNDPTITATTFSLSILLLFSAVNPNRVGIRYGDSRFTLVYRGIPLGTGSVPGFYQEPHGVTRVVATVAVDRVNLLQADAADLVRDAAVNDRVELRVFGDLGARIRIFNLDSPPVQVSVVCVIVISPRKQSLTYKQCGFDGLNV